MANKTYNQFCSIAHALDLVGERWTLLVVRNLLLGPRRFSDLMKGLPGVSTNILTDRLKSLEDASIIQTRYLPPPAASTVYELTQTGYGLTETLAALARWGSHTLGEPHAKQEMVTEGIAFMVIGVFYRADYLPLDLTCNFRVQDDFYDHTFGIRLSAEGIQIEEIALATADVDLSVGLEPLVPLSSKQKRLGDAISADQVQVEGNEQAVADLLGWVDG